MSGTGPRENIFPTRMALTNTKLRLKGAQTGHSLLAKKRDALTTRFRAILRRVDEVRSAPEMCGHYVVLRRCVASSGKAEDGPRDAARVVLARGGHVRDRRHLVPRPGAGEVRVVQGQGEAGERVRGRSACVRS